MSDAVMKTVRSATYVWTLPSVMILSILVEKRDVRSYLAVILGSVKSWYDAQVLGRGHIDRLGESIEWLKPYEDFK